MQHPAPTTHGADAALLEHAISHALEDTHRLMERVLESTRLVLQKLEDQSRTPGERHALLDARQQLTRLYSIMAQNRWA